jgi:hypothetical protein
MQDAARARTAARDAVDDITPSRLSEVIDDRLAAASMAPGVLAIASARVREADADRECVERRAAGVQLIYEGLRLTRSLVREDPWAADPQVDIPADVDVVAADVMVARGFRLLARTEAADKAVETVRAFGRSETDRRAGRGSAADVLEADVFELAAIAGATAAGDDAPRPLRQYVVGLAHAQGEESLATAAEVLPERLDDVMARVSAGHAEDPPRPQSAGSANRND